MQQVQVDLLNICDDQHINHDRFTYGDLASGVTNTTIQVCTTKLELKEIKRWDKINLKTGANMMGWPKIRSLSDTKKRLQKYTKKSSRYFKKTKLEGFLLLEG